MQGPASPFPGPSAPEKSYHAFSWRRGWEGPVHPASTADPVPRTVAAVTPPESREAGDPIACSHGYPCSLLGGFFSCPGAWPDAIRNGAPPMPLPPERVSRLNPYASLRITGQQEKGRQYC